MPLSTSIISFIQNLKWDINLPPDVEVMNPFLDDETMDACKRFYNKFYKDDHKRSMIIGINPGRFGGGVTGIPFTDPIRLQENCGIFNEWSRKQELSSVYMYDMINAYGGVDKFYHSFYVTAVSPLGFTRHGKNLNYYDDRQLQDSIKEFVVSCMKKQLTFGINRKVVFCLGDGKNFKYLSKLNDEYQFFEKVVPLSHPRFIMQYKLKKKEEYIGKYLNAFAGNFAP